MSITARQARRNKNLTLKQASEEAGISEPFLAQVERGERHIGAYYAERIAELYGVRKEEIFSPTRYAVREANGSKKTESA